MSIEDLFWALENMRKNLKHKNKIISEKKFKKSDFRIIKKTIFGGLVLFFVLITIIS